ncbi:patatin-like phospholipase family protein [Microlunatus ginsengisoli]|uniref:D-mannose binding lectin n=1 Tax=Microlunatus ginsengisoli TaxID=363863 RepID=A0ABP7ALN7_9ACTN
MTDALSLSGGGAKGDFQVGALRHLYDRGIRPTIICSTSVGSINAIKLAEGDDPADPSRGLAGLERQWESLQVNGDMYVEEDWLRDPDMDSHVRAALTGRSHSLGITAPVGVDLRAWGSELGFLVGKLIDLWNLGGIGGFLWTSGVPLLKSLSVIANKARALYNIGPVRRRLETELKFDKIAGWAASGGRLRMGAVSLESGRLRYVTETGGVVERDGTPVMAPAPMRPACAAIQANINQIEQDIVDAQADLAAATTTSQRQALSSQIRRLQASRQTAIRNLRTCLSSQPPSTVALTVSLVDGVMASASIPGIFPPVTLADETYVDGGVRELLPVQMATDLGADTIYAISAFTFNVSPHGSYASARLAEIVARSVEEVMLNEIGLDDLRVQPRPGAATPTVHLIAPDVEIHDVTTIDPGLIKINRDYGWMRAADVLDGIDQASRRWALATEIAMLRRDIWDLENRRYGHESPTRLADGTPLPDPSLQGDIDTAKSGLGALLDQRSAAGGPLPSDIRGWTTTLELHPWAPPTAAGNTMRGGQGLQAGQSVTSSNGLYRFVYQTDGNLVLYGPGGAIWDSTTAGTPTGFCIMQTDGNLVIYGPGNAALWASNTDGNPGSELVVQDDGNVVIYRANGSAAWDTGTFLPMGPAPTGAGLAAGETLLPNGSITSPNGVYRLVYQVDGNLVLYGPAGPEWSSQTSGSRPGVCIMQTDGNLVVYEPGANPVWASNTDGNPGSGLAVQDDGNLVIYRPGGVPIWDIL